MSRRLTAKRIAIIVANEFEDIELLYPLLRLSEEGASIVLVPVQGGSHPRPYFEGKPVTGRYGHTVPMRIMKEGVRYSLRSIEELNISDIDCLLFPAGFSPDILRRSERILELVREGRRTTGFVAVKDDLTNAGAKFVDAPAVRDGNIKPRAFQMIFPSSARRS
ncbi:MAG: DJ-1/PfpI family protein [Armatimonadota bacterium]|nr:DJ-1/PfpI family protein [Armatimonadota bacterium]